jgi:hypothetical protein
MPRGNQPFNEGSDFYFELHGPDGKPAGIAGFSEEKGHLKMDFFVSNGETHGVATRAFFELVKLALKKEKGVKMDDHFEARPLFTNSGLEQKKAGHWEIDGKKLAEKLRTWSRRRSHDVDVCYNNHCGAGIVFSQCDLSVFKRFMLSIIDRRYT